MSGYSARLRFMLSKLILAKFIPKYQITKKKYRFLVEILRDVGSGAMVGLTFALFIDKQLGLHQFFIGFFTVMMVWYTGSELTKKI